VVAGAGRPLVSRGCAGLIGAIFPGALRSPTALSEAQRHRLLAPLDDIKPANRIDATLAIRDQLRVLQATPIATGVARVSGALGTAKQLGC